MNIDETVAYMINELKKLPDGTKKCSGELACQVNSSVNQLELLFEIHNKFYDAAQKAGIFLDFSEHDDMDEGLPFNLDFTVRKR